LEICISCMRSGLQGAGLSAEDVCCDGDGTCASPAGWITKPACMLSCDNFCEPSFRTWQSLECPPVSKGLDAAFLHAASNCTFGDYYRACQNVKSKPEPSSPPGDNQRESVVKWTLGQGVGAGSCDQICAALPNLITVRHECAQDALTALNEHTGSTDTGAPVSEKILSMATLFPSIATLFPTENSWITGTMPGAGAPPSPYCVRAANPYVDRVHRATDGLCWGCGPPDYKCPASKCSDVPSDDNRQRLCPCRLPSLITKPLDSKPFRK
jgi:hypothetical protein